MVDNKCSSWFHTVLCSVNLLITLSLCNILNHNKLIFWNIFLAYFSNNLVDILWPPYTMFMGCNLNVNKKGKPNIEENWINNNSDTVGKIGIEKLTLMHKSFSVIVFPFFNSLLASKHLPSFLKHSSSHFWNFFIGPPSATSIVRIDLTISANSSISNEHWWSLPFIVLSSVICRSTTYEKSIE